MVTCQFCGQQYNLSVNQGSHRCPEDRRDPGVVLTRAVETVVGRRDVPAA